MSGGRPPVEMSGDPAFARRVARLAITSAIALAMLLLLCVRTLHASVAITGCLAAGWLLMPSILGLSLRWAWVRQAIIVPASLVTIGLAGICATALPASAIARAGWMLTTAGVLLGGVLGIWLWYRWVPVPAPLDDPFSRGRWSLIGVHIALVVGGLALIAGAPQAPAPDPDVQRYELVIRPDLASRRLRLTATLDIRNPSETRDFTFLLAGWYDTVVVRSRAGLATVRREGDEVTVRTERAARDERLVFQLSGAPGQSAGDNRPILADSSIYLLWSDRYYPVDFDDWAMVSTRIEVPGGFRVFAPGRRVLATDRGALHIESYETSQPIRAASVMADARWVDTERTVAGRRMRMLLHPASRAYAEQIFRTSADVLDFYERRFGRYAFDQFTFATVEGIFARRAVAGGVIYAPPYLADELRATGHDAHETALLWWFYTIAGRGPGSFQWTEGFGDYAEMLYDEARGFSVPTHFESYRRGYLRTAGTPAELSITAPRGPLAGNFVHGRLPWVMHLLRFAVGDSAFDRGVRLLFERWRFRSFTLEEFVATLAEGTGSSLDWWRHDWLDRGGVPELTAHADIVADSGGYRIDVSLRQTGALYHLPLEIGIESARGLRLERVVLDERTHNFRFSSMEMPTRILVDPRRWWLARITTR